MTSYVPPPAEPDAPPPAAEDKNWPDQKLQGNCCKEWCYCNERSGLYDVRKLEKNIDRGVEPVPDKALSGCRSLLRSCPRQACSRCCLSVINAVNHNVTAVVCPAVVTVQVFMPRTLSRKLLFWMTSVRSVLFMSTATMSVSLAVPHDCHVTGDATAATHQTPTSLLRSLRSRMRRRTPVGCHHWTLNWWRFV